MHEYQQGDFTINTDPTQLDVDVIHVFILEAFQGQGPGKWLMKTVTSHPQLPCL